MVRLWSLLAALPLVLGQGLASSSSSTGVVVIERPSVDPFYRPPQGYEYTLPGSILRIRQAAGNLSTLHNASAAYQILYRTTDSRYNATSAVTTLFVPRIANGSKLLSYQIPYDTAAVDFSPSYSLYGGADPNIVEGLRRGWYVSTPDYEGPLGSFTAGVMSGHATLDGVRAVLNAGFGLDARGGTRYALWGYSGGALASEWAAELQNQYAPELDFAGVALGGLTPNVTSVMMSIDGGIEAGIVVSGILGLASQYPEYLDQLVAMLRPTGRYNASGFLAARNLSLSGTIVKYAGQNVSDYFLNGAAELATPAAMYVTNRDGQMGYHGVPAMPVFAYKAVGDELSRVSDTDALVRRYCAVGADILYHRNELGSHTTELLNGLGRALNFVDRVLAGAYNHTGCSTFDVYNTNNSTALLV